MCAPPGRRLRRVHSLVETVRLSPAAAPCHSGPNGRERGVVELPRPRLRWPAGNGHCTHCTSISCGAAAIANASSLSNAFQSPHALCSSTIALCPKALRWRSLWRPLPLLLRHSAHGFPGHCQPVRSSAGAHEEGRQRLFLPRAHATALARPNRNYCTAAATPGYSKPGKQATTTAQSFRRQPIQSMEEEQLLQPELTTSRKLSATCNPCGGRCQTLLTSNWAAPLTNFQKLLQPGP